MRFFADRCKKEGIIFIGPCGKTIESVGSKIAAKKTMKAAGIPVIPGSENGIDDLDTAIDIAQAIGYPVIVKASAGGGGIGMKVVRKPRNCAKLSSPPAEWQNHHLVMQQFLLKNTWKSRAILNSRYLLIIMAALSMWVTVNALSSAGTRN